MADDFSSLPARDPDHDAWSFTGLMPSAGVPDFKRALIDPADWQGFNTAFADLDGTDRLQQYAASRIYAEEGGRRWNADRTAYAGIRPVGLAEAHRRDPTLGGLTLGEDLTHDQIARIYAANMLAGAQRYGGFEELARLNHDDTVAAIADAQFHHGPDDGALFVREAVSNAKLKLPQEAALKLPALDARTGPQDTLDQLRALNEAGYGALFRGALADRRTKKSGTEKARYNRYR